MSIRFLGVEVIFTGSDYPFHLFEGVAMADAVIICHFVRSRDIRACIIVCNTLFSDVACFRLIDAEMTGRL